MWQWQFVIDILPALLRAFANTILVTLQSFALAACAATAVLYLLRLDNAVGRTTAAVSDFIRKTPILVQLYFAYYVLPSVGIELSAWSTGIAVLGFHYSFYLAEVYKTALGSVPKGQWEAASALGITSKITFYRVIVPQLLPLVVPNAGNYLIYMFKDTPYLSAITVTEVMNIASKTGSESFRYVEPITICGLLFLITSWISAWLIMLAERSARGAWSARV